MLLVTLHLSLASIVTVTEDFQYKKNYSLSTVWRKKDVQCTRICPVIYCFVWASSLLQFLSLKLEGIAKMILYWPPHHEEAKCFSCSQAPPSLLSACFSAYSEDGLRTTLCRCEVEKQNFHLKSNFATLEIRKTMSASAGWRGKADERFSSVLYIYLGLFKMNNPHRGSAMIRFSRLRRIPPRGFKRT